VPIGKAEVAKPPADVLLAVWHDSQATLPTGTCAVVDKVTNDGVLGSVIPLAWHVAQAMVLPLALWFMVQVAKPPGVVVEVWQDSHAAVIAIWPVGMPITVVVTEFTIEEFPLD
jgi:hypothetical protein